MPTRIAPAISLTSQAVDGGRVWFERESGTNLLVRQGETRLLKREAPRVLQVGLLTPCNLDCSFCYRDRSAPSRLTAPFLTDLLRRASEWGVLEVAFGGGEPFLFPGFVDLLDALHRSTPLGLNVTTNGTLLTPDLLERLHACQEIRISAYQNNHYRKTLRLLRGRQAGVNWLVTPENVGLVECFVTDFLSQGAKNVLLLGYKGPDPGLHLSEPGRAELRRTLSRLQGLPIRLDICWHPYFSDLPRLFERRDCGAGDEFLVITPDRAIQPCSFHQERIAFETFEDLQAVYRQLRARRPAAEARGCTRTLFSLLPTVAEPTPGVFLWHAHSSNNSGYYTILGRFETKDAAQKVAESLRELARAHETFLASPEGHDWIKAREYDGSYPTPPLQQFGEAHGFDWSKYGDGLWWEQDGVGAPVLTVGAIENTVVVYHVYCMGLPEEPFRAFFEATGAVGFWSDECVRPFVRFRFTGSNDHALAVLDGYLTLVGAAEHPSVVTSPPPWGLECVDSRVNEDEDRSAVLGTGVNAIHRHGSTTELVLSLQNLFAGALAVENWLRDQGFRDIVVEIDDQFERVERGEQSSVEARTGLFQEIRPLTARLQEATPEEVVEIAYHYWSLPEPVQEALLKIPPARRAELGWAGWKKRMKENVEVTECATTIICGIGPLAAEWTRELWSWLMSTNPEHPGRVVAAVAAALPGDEAFSLGEAWWRVRSCRPETPVLSTGGSAFAEVRPACRGMVERSRAARDGELRLGTVRGGVGAVLGDGPALA